MKTVFAVLLTLLWTTNTNAEMLEFRSTVQENMSNCVRAAKNGLELKTDHRHAKDTRYWYFEGDVFGVSTSIGTTLRIYCDRYIE